MIAASQVNPGAEERPGLLAAQELLRQFAPRKRT